MVKSFAEEHVITLKYIKLKLTKHLKVYASKVSKAKGNKQQNMKIWLIDNCKLMDLLKKKPNLRSSDQNVKNFYFDQQSLARKMVLSKDIDEEHKKEVAEQHIVSQDLADKELIETLLRNCLITSYHSLKVLDVITRPQLMFLRIDQEWLVVPNLMLKFGMQTRMKCCVSNLGCISC